MSREPLFLIFNNKIQQEKLLPSVQTLNVF